MEFTYFIGVDVSKNELDLALFKGKEFLFHNQIDNNQNMIDLYVKGLSKLEGFKLSNAVFCKEHTGIYNNPMLEYLNKKKGNVWLEPATQIKYSLGNIRGKNDKIDAIRIGEYAYKNREDITLWRPKRMVIKKLTDLTALRNRLISVRKILATPLKEQTGFVKESLDHQCQKVCQRTLNSINADIRKVDDKINKVISEDQELLRLFELITSVKGVGKETAVQMIISTNEFKDFNNPKKFACYAGVVPFSRASGLRKGKASISHMANKKMKKLLHMAALVAIVYNRDMKTYYHRKVAEGKNKMSVINAVRNKLIHRIFACLRENRKYEKNYIPRLA